MLGVQLRRFGWGFCRGHFVAGLSFFRFAYVAGSWWSRTSFVFRSLSQHTLFQKHLNF